MKKRSEMTVEEKMNFILDGATWEEAKEVGCLILGKVVAKAVHVDGNKDIFHELFETVAKKGDQWVQEGGSWYLAIAKASKRLETDEMTNDEKARELSDSRHCIGLTCEQCRDIVAIKMAQWKDEQFAAQKNELIENACSWLENIIFDKVDALFYDDNDIEFVKTVSGKEFADIFRKAIGGGSL